MTLLTTKIQNKYLTSIISNKCFINHKEKIKFDDVSKSVKV